MEYKNIIIKTENDTAVLTLNRPEKLNALNIETLKEIYSAFIDISNNSNILSVIITGSGEKAFAAGADIKEINNLNVQEGKKFSEFGQQVFRYIENFRKPVIAAVNGFALGGGCELALSCHIRIASENAKFGQPEVNLGIIPGYGGTHRLARLTGRGRALELIVTGDIIDANEAYRIGLINKIYPQKDLLVKAEELCGKINSKGSQAISMALQAVSYSIMKETIMAENMEAALFGLCCGTDDFKEGTSAFLEKRNPQFKNK
ncbi:MAG: enoyl-CoA hydratase [Ignavibacteriales bacterium]|nr:MAG: enoyl-CoA hydratase [Ignavibacteriales bacterium]